MDRRTKVMKQELTGVTAIRLQDRLCDLAADLERARAITEDRRAILKALFAVAQDINALETGIPVIMEV